MTRLIIVVLLACGPQLGSDIVVQRRSKRSAEHRPACACGYGSNGDGVYPAKSKESGLIDFDVSRAEEWRWGSLWHWNQKPKPKPPLLSSWPIPLPRGWIERVNQPLTEKALSAVRDSAKRGSSLRGS